MKVCELAKEIGAEYLNKADTEKVISSGFVCDLLSWAMAKGKSGMAWVTVQSHLNVIAIAALHDISCVVLPENINMEQSVIDKANEEGINILVSGLSAYEICGILYKNGVK